MFDRDEADSDWKWDLSVQWRCCRNCDNRHVDLYPNVDLGMCKITDRKIRDLDKCPHTLWVTDINGCGVVVENIATPQPTQSNLKKQYIRRYSGRTHRISRRKGIARL